jgi:GDP-L-fucose synthase
MKNKIIVTGGNGLLGSAIRNKKDCTFFTRKEMNLETDSFSDFLNSKEDTNTIIHCAAKVGGVGANMNNNFDFFQKNIKIDQNVLNACLEKKIDNVVTILSTCVFPDKVEYPLTAEKIDLGAPHFSNYGYSYAKRLLYYQTKMYRNVVDKNWISVIPTNLYGANDNFNLENSHLIPALIRKAYEASISGDDFIVWGDGSPLRQFVYSEDMADIIIWAVENWKSENPLMAVNEREYSIKEVAMIIANRFGISENKIIFDKTKPNGQFRKPAKSDVSWFEFTPLEVGLNRTIDWFIENYNTKNIRL